MNVTEKDLIREAGRRLVEAAPDSEVLLFGSRATGSGAIDSDFDFMVIRPRVENPAEESVKLRKSLRGLRIPADVVVVSQHDVDEWRSVRGSLVHAALRDGVVLSS